MTSLKLYYFKTSYSGSFALITQFMLH